MWILILIDVALEFSTPVHEISHGEAVAITISEMGSNWRLIDIPGFFYYWIQITRYPGGFDEPALVSSELIANFIQSNNGSVFANVKQTKKSLATYDFGSPTGST
ncbi:MAG: hypothetical protein JKY10_01455 [Cohaesibacteraceae bacterium]|nr:hypothetical protein [Cohaesibacteraceae bacterium]